LNCDKIRKLGWQAKVPFEDGLKHAVLWYRDNSQWWRTIKAGTFRDYYERMYGARLRER